MPDEKKCETSEPRAIPGGHPNSRANLNPTKPGQVLNPAGCPKGSRNIRTILDEMLHRYVDVETLKHLNGIDATIELCKQLTDAKNDLPNDTDPKYRARLYDLIVAAQFARALQEQTCPASRNWWTGTRVQWRRNSRTSRH